MRRAWGGRLEGAWGTGGWVTAGGVAIIAVLLVGGAHVSCTQVGDGYCVVGDDCTSSTSGATSSSGGVTSGEPLAGPGVGSSSATTGQGGGTSSSSAGGGGAGGGCVAESLETTCSEGRCGTQINDCGDEVVCPEDACAAPERCGGGGEADTCGGCDWRRSYPAKAGCPDNEWWCGPELPPADVLRTDADYVLLNLCGDDVVVDPATGLMWQRNELIADRHINAVDKCAISSRAGFEDWRLPTRIELESLVDYQRSGPVAILTSLFQGVQSGTAPGAHNFTWTSTPRAQAPAPAFWTIDFRYGNPVPLEEPVECDIRCVR